MNIRQHILPLLLCLLCTALSAQESCYERYFRERGKEILLATDENDDSYDELKKEVIARQVLRGETPYAQYIKDRYEQPVTTMHSVQKQALHSPLVLAIDTVTGACHLLAEDGTILAEARIAMVDSTWYMWLSVDPLADKNISSSPYMYCNGNPIMLIDPDGRDVWELSDNGVVLNTITDDTRDAFRVNGKELSFKAGIVSSFTQEKKFGGTSSFVFEKGCESEAANVFKFLADNTNVEYGLINTKSQISTILTDHDAHSVNAYTRLSTTEDVSSFFHNHPGGNLNASGYGVVYRGDHSMANKLDSSIDLFVYSKNQVRQFLPTQQVSVIEPWSYAPVGQITSQSPSLIFRVINAITR